jgi:hypothetical protein
VEDIGKNAGVKAVEDLQIAYLHLIQPDLEKFKKVLEGMPGDFSKEFNRELGRSMHNAMLNLDWLIAQNEKDILKYIMAIKDAFEKALIKMQQSRREEDKLWVFLHNFKPEPISPDPSFDTPNSEQLEVLWAPAGLLKPYPVKSPNIREVTNGRLKITGRAFRSPSSRGMYKVDFLDARGTVIRSVPRPEYRMIINPQIIWLDLTDSQLAFQKQDHALRISWHSNIPNGPEDSVNIPIVHKDIKLESLILVVLCIEKGKFPRVDYTVSLFRQEQNDCVCKKLLGSGKNYRPLAFTEELLLDTNSSPDKLAYLYPGQKVRLQVEISSKANTFDDDPWLKVGLPGIKLPTWQAQFKLRQAWTCEGTMLTEETPLTELFSAGVNNKVFTLSTPDNFK